MLVKVAQVGIHALEDHGITPRDLRKTLEREFGYGNFAIEQAKDLREVEILVEHSQLRFAADTIRVLEMESRKGRFRIPLYSPELSSPCPYPEPAPRPAPKTPQHKLLLL